MTDPDPAVAETLAKTLSGADGAPLNVFATLARHPRLLKRFNVLGGLFLAHGTLPARERELMILRTAWRCGSEYEWGQHVLIGRTAGLSDAEIEAVPLPIADGGWPETDRVLLAFTDEVLDQVEVSDATWAAAHARWDDQQMLEMTMLVGCYRMLAGVLRSVRVQREPRLPAWPDTVPPAPGRPRP